METPIKLSRLFDDVSDLSTTGTATASAFQTPRRGGSKTPLKSPYRTPLRSPYRGRMGRVNHKMSILARRIFGSGFVWFTSILFSFFGVFLCCLIGRSIVMDLRVQKQGCENGEQKYVGPWKSYCVESDADKKAWDLRGVVGIVMRQKTTGKRIQVPKLKALVEENGGYNDLEPEVLMKAIEYCSDLSVYNNYVYWTLTEKSEQVTIIVITLISLVVCISSSVIRAKKQ